MKWLFLLSLYGPTESKLMGPVECALSSAQTPPEPCQQCLRVRGAQIRFLAADRCSCCRTRWTLTAYGSAVAFQQTQVVYQQVHPNVDRLSLKTLENVGLCRSSAAPCASIIRGLSSENWLKAKVILCEETMSTSLPALHVFSSRTWWQTQKCGYSSQEVGIHATNTWLYAERYVHKSHVTLCRPPKIDLFAQKVDNIDHFIGTCQWVWYTNKQLNLCH